MSDEEKNASEAAVATAAATEPSEQPYLDEHTTEPHGPNGPQKAAPPAPGKWEMPKPKFQQTSGYLPQGYLKDMEAAAEAAKVAPGSEDTTKEQAAFVPNADQPASPAALPDIEPQPDLADLIPAESVTETSTPLPVKKSGSSAVMIVLGLIAVIIFVSLFLAAIYFLFLAKPAQSQF